MNKLEKSNLVKIDNEHRLFERHGGIAISHAVTCGRLLSEAKAKVRHGHWMGWVKENCEFPYQKAQKYMRLATTGRFENGTMSVTKALSMAAQQRVVEVPVVKLRVVVQVERYVKGAVGRLSRSPSQRTELVSRLREMATLIAKGTDTEEW